MYGPNIHHGNVKSGLFKGTTW